MEVEHSRQGPAVLGVEPPAHQVRGPHRQERNFHRPAAQGLVDLDPIENHPELPGAPAADVQLFAPGDDSGLERDRVGKPIDRKPAERFAGDEMHRLGGTQIVKRRPNHDLLEAARDADGALGGIRRRAGGKGEGEGEQRGDHHGISAGRLNVGWPGWRTVARVNRSVKTESASRRTDPVRGTGARPVNLPARIADH